jgi:hypothetical protein
VIGETHTGAQGPEVKPVGYLKITGTGRYTSENAASVTVGKPLEPNLNLTTETDQNDPPAKKKKPHLVTGLDLLSLGSQTRADARRAHEGHDRRPEGARARQGRAREALKTATGKQKVEVERELTDVQKKINSITTDRYQAEMKKLADATKKHLDEAKQAVTEKKAAFEQAFQGLATQALDAFDRETQTKLKALQVTVGRRRNRLVPVRRRRHEDADRAAARRPGAREDGRRPAEADRRREQGARRREAERGRVRRRLREAQAAAAAGSRRRSLRPEDGRARAAGAGRAHRR